MKAVYIGQFDWIWKLTIEQWLEVCRSGAEGRGYNLDSYRRLRTRPRFLHRDEEERGRHWCSRHDILYFEPMDWFPEEFAEALEQAESLIIRGICY